MLASQILRGFAKAPQLFKNWKIVKGDNVMVNHGKDKGKIGKVMKVYRNTNQIIIEGVNVRYKEVKNEDQGVMQKSIIPKISPIHVSNANLLDPEKGKGTRVRAGFMSDGTKVRISKMSNKIIPKPNRDHLTYRARTGRRKEGELDTSAKLALEVTYQGEDFFSVRQEFEKYIAEKEKLESLLVFDK